jgi:hypothetical protein
MLGIFISENGLEQSELPLAYDPAIYKVYNAGAALT